jgi:hypothetical protein
MELSNPGSSSLTEQKSTIRVMREGQGSMEVVDVCTVSVRVQAPRGFAKEYIISVIEAALASFGNQGEQSLATGSESHHR